MSHAMANYRDELDEAREEIRQLKEQLREALTPHIIPHWAGLRLSPADRFYLALLIKTEGLCPTERMMTAWQIKQDREWHARPCTDDAVKVTICRLRKKLKPFGVEISTVLGQGYYLSEENKTRLADLQYGVRAV